MGTHVVNLRGWPGLEHWKAPPAMTPYSDRLGDRIGLIVASASLVGAVPEQFGLGAYLQTLGPSVIAGGLIVADAVSAPAMRTIKRWANGTPLMTTMGPRPWDVCTLGEFYDPRMGVFTKTAYSGAGWCIGADLGRTLGIGASHCSPRNGPQRDGWEVWLPGWGKPHTGGRWKRVSPHRPAIRIRARRVGWQVQFGPLEQGNGKQIGGHQWTGAFIDLLSLAYALDGDRGASFSEHRENHGLAPYELPISVPWSNAGAGRMAASVLAMHEFALVLDRRAAEWFSTSTDRREQRGRLDMARVSSPGALAAQIPARFGVKPPLGKFKLTHEEHLHWSEAFHGGWCEADPQLLGRPLPVVSADMSSCFPLVAHLVDWWRLLCADSIRRTDVTEVLRNVCLQATRDPTVVLDPSVWRRFACTLVQVVPDAEPWPIEVEDGHRPDGRLEVVTVTSPDRPMSYAWPDVVAAAVLSGRVPQIERATRFLPVGRQKGLSPRLPLLPGVVLTLNEDPVLALVRKRQEVRGEDATLAGELRVLVNSLVFGNACRFDPIYKRVARACVTDEKPGPLSYMPLASTITAGSHLLLAVVDRIVKDKGGTTVYRDTDSAVILASPDGGFLQVDEGETRRLLSWDEIDEVFASFDKLSPSAQWPVWKVKRGTTSAPLQALIFGAKRHYQFSKDIDLQVHDRTETALGGIFSDPTALRGRSADGGRKWSLSAATREVSFVLSFDGGGRALRPRPAWDFGESPAFPALRRLSVTTPEVLRSLPYSLGLHPGSRYLEALVAGTRTGFSQSPIALDPGGHLAQWRHLGWTSRSTGEPVSVTTTPMEIDAVLLETLDERAVRWTAPPRAKPITHVDVDLIQHLGRVSGVIDADLDGHLDLAGPRPVYDQADRHGAVVALARRLGKRALMRETGLSEGAASRAVSGRHLSASNMRRVLESMDGAPSARRCALEGCQVEVSRPNARYCCPAHADRAYRRRRRDRSTATREEPDATAGLPACRACGALLLGLAARRGTCHGCEGTTR